MNASFVALGLLLIFSSRYVIAYDVVYDVSPEDCNQTSFFDPITHKCRSCENLQTPSSDRLDCQCEKGYHMEVNEKSKAAECITCNSESQEICALDNLQCDLYDVKGTKTVQSLCNGRKEIKVCPFFWNIAVLKKENNQTTFACLKCPTWYQPNHEQTACIPCDTKCHCPDDYEDVNGTCVRGYEAIPDTPSLYTITVNRRAYVSNYLRDSVRPVAIKCKVRVT